MKNKVVVKMTSGSYMYGMQTPESDIDYNSIVLPTAEQILMQKANFTISESTGDDKSRNGPEDIDEETFSLMQFLKLASKGETLAIDMLHAPCSAILEENLIWKNLVKNRTMFYTKNMKAYIGYVRKQAAKYGVKGSRLQVLEDAMNVIKGNALPTIGDYFNLLPINEHAQIITVDNEHVGKQVFYEICGRKFQDSNRWDYVLDCLEKIYSAYGVRAKAAKDNNGIDWKALHHALRAGYQAKYIYSVGTFSYPLPEKEYLMDVKSGKLDFMTEVQPVLEALVDEVMILAENSNYPDNVDMKEVNNFILDVHTQILKDHFNNGDQ